MQHEHLVFHLQLASLHLLLNKLKPFLKSVSVSLRVESVQLFIFSVVQQTIK